VKREHGHVVFTKVHGEELFVVYPRIRHAAKRGGDMAFFCVSPCPQHRALGEENFFTVWPNSRYSAKRKTVTWLKNLLPCAPGSGTRKEENGDLAKLFYAECQCTVVLGEEKGPIVGWKMELLFSLPCANA
jgi:hypothetical protein